MRDRDKVKTRVKAVLFCFNRKSFIWFVVCSIYAVADSWSGFVLVGSNCTLPQYSDGYSTVAYII
jgi:hypothetical protein